MPFYFIFDNFLEKYKGYYSKRKFTLQVQLKKILHAVLLYVEVSIVAWHPIGARSWENVI